jgi:hypothetical protein
MFGQAICASSAMKRMAPLPDVIVVPRRVVHCSAAGIVIGVLLLPTVVWILSDRHVWAWDQSYYAAATLDLWNTHGIGRWLAAMKDALHGMPPLLVWLAQFLVPLHAIMPDFESTILLVNAVMVFGMLALTYATARRMQCGLLASLSGTILVGGSAFIVDLSHQYLVEICQAFAVALLVAVCWRVERLSWVRCSALLILAAAIAQATKAQSFIFWVPVLAYCGVVLWFARRRARPPATGADFALLAGALAFFTLAAVWYWSNWQRMMAHFAFATSDAALKWGFHRVDLSFKIPFWVNSLSIGISPIQTISILVLVLVSAGLALGLKRSLARRFTTTLGRAIDNGTLLSLALAGTVLLVILAYSLQTNEDIRYLTALIPLIGTLAAWSLSVLRARWLSLIFLAAFVVNAATNHALSFGVNPWKLSPNGWVLPPDQDLDARSRLQAIITATCTPETLGRWIILAVNYASLNANSANFFAAKDASTLGHRCLFTNFPLFETDIEKLFAFIDTAQAYYVITEEPSSQPRPDWINSHAKPVAERLAQGNRYALSMKIGDVLIYKRNP